MKKFIVGIFVMASFAACDRVKESTKKAIDKSAETAGKVGSDIVDKVGEGVNKSMQSTVELSDALKKAGLQTTKVSFTEQKGATENGISVYFIFDKDFSAKINVKVFDEKGLEYGRTTAEVKGKKGMAAYYDIFFDKRVNLESKSKFVIE